MTPTPSFLPGAALLVSGGGCAPQASPWGSGKGSEAPGYCRLGSQKADPGWSLASMKFFKVCPWGQQLRKERKGTGLDRGRVQLGGRLTPPGVARRAPKLGQGGWNLTPPRPPPIISHWMWGPGKGCDHRGSTVVTWGWQCCWGPCLQTHGLRARVPGCGEARPLVPSLQPRSPTRSFPDQDFGEKIAQGLELLDI